MKILLHHLILQTAIETPDGLALVEKKSRLNYGELAERTSTFADGLCHLGLQKQERVAIFLPKNVDNVIGMFGATAAGGVMVPINPVLKPPQVQHIIHDSGAAVLVTSSDRLKLMGDALANCETLRTVIVTDNKTPEIDAHFDIVAIDALDGTTSQKHRVIDTDIAALMYTSGSTGKPKGVILSHRNMVAGAESVATYIGNRSDDRILCALPLSFDAGFSQVSTAFWSGAAAILHDYFLPKGTLKVTEEEKITGITAVPPLWMQLSELDWPDSVKQRIRYFANTGGKMPRTLLNKLREHFPSAKPYLMYGLTEAFRSTYLPPSEVDNRPDSIGKAIPNAEIMVARPDGTECDVDEPGELVHRGALVGLGYWRDPERTAQRYKPSPGQSADVPTTELAVWSGDTVRRDADGYLYFVGRKDDMIKTSGYRVSPTDLEESLYASGIVSEAGAFGVDDHALGQRIVVCLVAREGVETPEKALQQYCRKELPSYMVPSEYIWHDALPRNPNGKIDRATIARTLADREQEPKA
ncbi:MAG: acyl-CoA ligase (AMP-forming), exosortase A system-associated [Woeseiaceae bacterium]